MTIRFDQQVAIVTGAGQGLGRSHALGLAARGAKVVVNDLGGAEGVSEAANSVVNEIIAAGGEAIAHGASVADESKVAHMVKTTMEKWGRIDILINNAGILRDKSFVKMDMADFNLVMDVHLKGSAICAKAVWEIMREQNYGRIVMTTSSSGLYGNFGQSNYGSAKCGVVGLMNTLVLEGHKYGIKVNSLAPTAFTQMTDGLLPPEMLKLLSPESVTAGLITLCDKDAPNRTILCAGAGAYAQAYIMETAGLYLPEDEQTPEKIRENMKTIGDKSTAAEQTYGFQQAEKLLKKAADHLGVELPKI